MSVIRRSLLGVFLGIMLTIESAFVAGVGHGSYAPLAFTASIAAFIPFVALAVGPILWLLYFLVIPKLQGWKTTAAICSVLVIHMLPGLYFAHDDPAIVEMNVGTLLLFGASFLTTLLLLLFFSSRRKQS
jgi:hypothetical protein